MALSRIKTWIAEILTYTDLNAEFDNVLTNGPSSLSSPRTSNFDLDGYQIILDAGGTSYAQASTANLLDVYGASTLLFKIDMTVATPVNGLSFVASAAGTGVDIVSRGADTNTGIRIQPKGTGKLTVDGGFNWVAAGGSADAITATYSPVITALDDGLLVGVLAGSANATTTPTFAPNGLTAKTIVRDASTALTAGDIAGANHAILLRYSSSLDKWLLQNPATASIALNGYTTDTTGGATGDFIPFVDVSESNANNKVAVSDLFTNAINNATADAAPDPNADYVPTYDASATSYKKVLLKNLKVPEHITIAVGDETTAITTGTAKVTFRMPYAFTLTDCRASVNTVSSSGLPTVNIKESGVTIFSTKLTIDASEKTSTTAATPYVFSDTSLADDAEMTIDIDVAGTGAKGLKVILYGYRT
jgi:hypothetical protein